MELISGGKFYVYVHKTSPDHPPLLMNFYVLALVVLIIDVILYVLLPLYDNTTVTMGMTTFYAYQIIMLIVSSVLFLLPGLIGDKKKSG